jgi:diacylglycerol kinase family enzyme
MPLDLDEAAAALAAGRVQAVDVGEVNDRVFVNNSSIGIYPIVVEDRDEQRRRHGRSKPVAMLRATLDVLRRAHTLTVTLRSDEGSRSLETPFVVVANNAYEMGLFAIARRGSLDGGELSVYVAEHTNRLGLAALMLRALVGRLEHADQLDTMCLEELEIDCPRRPLRVSLDGEVVRLATPLRYRVRPRALKVLVPPDA